MPCSPRVWLDLDLPAVRGNFRRIARTVEPAEVMVVLKANAYGLGVVPLAKALVEAGATRIGLAEVREATPEVLRLGVRVQILGGLLPSEIPEAVRLGLVCPVTDEQSARLLSGEAGRRKKRVRVHFLVDTGMGRLGLWHKTAPSIIRRCLKLPGLIPEGLYSHLANANTPAHPHTRRQLDRFNTVLEDLKDLSFQYVHIANSDGINNFPASYFNLVRTGINLYGVFDLEGRRAYRLKPTLSLRSRLIACRRLPMGANIGYGCTHSLGRDTRVGTLPAGYADGVPLALSNAGRVLIRGAQCPVLGRISMDYTTVDLSGCPAARVGDVVTLIGRNGQWEITVEEWARAQGSIPYQVICGIGNRVQRIYRDPSSKGRR